MTGQSTDLVVHSSLDVNFWIAGAPPVEAARPARCPRCGAAARVPGRTLGLVGHGLRDRQLRGPPRPGAPPEIRTVRARRYRCRPCNAVMSVVPREVRARRHFAAGAIAAALFVFGKLRETAAEAARSVGSWASVAGAWRLLRRWIGAVDSGALFPGVRASPPGWSPRKRAERIAMTLAAHAPTIDDDDELARVFAGAALAR